VLLCVCVCVCVCEREREREREHIWFVYALLYHKVTYNNACDGISLMINILWGAWKGA